MRSTKRDRKFSFADSVELTIPRFDEVALESTFFCKFNAVGVSWQVEIFVEKHVTVKLSCWGDLQGLVGKMCYTRLGDAECSNKSRDKRGELQTSITPGNGPSQSFAPKLHGIYEKVSHDIYDVPHVEVIDPKRAYLDQNKSLCLHILIQDRVWLPTPRPAGNPLLMMMYGEDRYMDASFIVGDQTIHAHKAVLQKGAPQLWEMVQDATEPVELPGVGVDEFVRILKWIYRNEFVTVESLDQAQRLLVAASKFELQQLKIHTESFIADKFLTVANAAELMVLGHVLCCAVLQEASMELYVLYPEEVRESEGWGMVLDTPALVEELLEMSAKEHSGNERTSVRTLRNHLVWIGLPGSIDGSRAMMIQELAAHGISFA